MITVVKGRNTQPHDDTAEHSHLKGLHAAHRCNGSVQDPRCDATVRKYFTRNGKHCID